ncbi:MAG: alanine--glyoxylate aminotransferase family protein, partial [Candidatus Micrarchaeota archaeon]|nr:alanine--glyoxylate aminotransferase family protein [Candidatus Micrarchaeota archaeon]
MLLTPGPVAVLPQVSQAQTWSMINHRGKAFQSIYGPIRQNLAKMMNCQEAHVMTGSGTLAIEANVQAAMADGGKALVLSNGAFGDKLKEHCQLYYCAEKKGANGQGGETRYVRLKDAQGWNLERAREHIDKAAADGFKLLAMVHHETSPGILNKIEEICKYAKSKSMITIVDGTSAWPAYPFDQKKMGVDFYSFASQKALGMPSGIAVVGLSEDGAKAVDAAPKRT